MGKLNRDIELIVKSSKRIDKSFAISLREGLLKGFGILMNSSNTTDYYRMRDNWKGMLYSMQRLLCRYCKGGVEANIEQFNYVVKLMLRLKFISILCVDKVLGNKGGFIAGVDGKDVLSDKKLSNFIQTDFNHLLDSGNFDIRRVSIPKKNGGKKIWEYQIWLQNLSNS